MFVRRQLLRTALAGGAASLLATTHSSAAQVADAALEVIDTHVNLFHWPCRRLPLDEPDKLIAHYRHLGITQAWAGSFEGLLHRDVAAVNHRLAEACKAFGELRPVGSINLSLPDWQSDVRRCREQHGCHAVRLHPNYHGYTLADPSVAQLLELTADWGMLIQIAVCMEDVRTQHPLLQVADVDWTPLPALLRQKPPARVQLLGARLTARQLASLAAVPNLYVDTARAEGIDGVQRLVRGLPAGRVWFASHAPFLIPEAALIRVGEGDLNADEIQAVLSSNVRAALS